MSRVLLLVALALAVLGLGPAFADDTMPPAPYAYRQLDDPAKEAKAQALMETIRCLTCQSQSIADSDASMAGDMRSQIRERIAAGEDYSPRVTRLTWPLFAAPLVILLLAAVLLRKRFTRVRGSGDATTGGAPE
jgi:cytochrome c-type biogenesis protein CcmH